jgi:hypothetical protein
MSAADVDRHEHRVRSRLLTLTAIAVMSLSACGGHVVASPETGGVPSKVAAAKAAGCARVLSIKSQLADIQAQVFQMMSVGNDSGVWGLDFEPTNQVALQALGMAPYNLGNDTEAEKQWRVAEWLDPDNAEVHYNLGFLYQNQTPPDTVKMKAQWKKAVLIDPDSEFGKLAAAGLK